MHIVQFDGCHGQPVVPQGLKPWTHDQAGKPFLDQKNRRLLTDISHYGQAVGYGAVRDKALPAAQHEFLAVLVCGRSETGGILSVLSFAYRYGPNQFAARKRFEDLLDVGCLTKASDQSPEKPGGCLHRKEK